MADRITFAKPYTVGGSRDLVNVDTMLQSLYEYTQALEDKITGGDSDEASAVNLTAWKKGPWTLDNIYPTDNIATIRQDPISGTTYNDYAPDGIDAAVVLELEPTGSVTITGIKQYGRQRRLLGILNRDASATITIPHENTGSTARYRFDLPGGEDIVVGPKQALWCYYNIGSERWQLFITPHTSGGLAGGGTVITTTVNVSEAQLEAGNTSPRVLVTAVAGAVIVPISAVIKVVVSSIYTSNPVWSLRHAGLAGNLTGTISPVLTGVGTTYHYIGHLTTFGYAASPVNTNLVLFLNGDPTGGATGVATAVVEITYYLVNDFA